MEKLISRLIALCGMAVSVYVAKHSKMTTVQTIEVVVGSGAVLVFGEFFIERYLSVRRKWLSKAPCKKCGLLKPGFRLYESDHAGGMVCANCYEKAQGRLPLEMLNRSRSKYFDRLRRAYEKKHGLL